MHQAERAEFEKFDASNYKVGIVVAQFNLDITNKLLDSAMTMLTDYGIPKRELEVFKVAGCVEVPLILQKLAASRSYDCLVALGAVIRGQTPHFDYVCKIVSEGVLEVMLKLEVPIGFGILTTNNHKQALARIDAGAGAVQADLRSAKINKQLN